MTEKRVIAQMASTDYATIDDTVPDIGPVEGISIVVDAQGRPISAMWQGGPLRFLTRSGQEPLASLMTEVVADTGLSRAAL